MPAFFQYFHHITYYLMFAAVAGMIAPAGKYRRFVSLVLGLVLVLLLVQPLAAMFSERDLPVTEWFNFGQIQAGEDAFYAAWWDDYFSGAFEAQLEAQLSRLLAANNFTLHRAEFDYADDFSAITAVRVAAARAQQNERVPFIRVQPPQISPIQIGAAAETEICRLASEVKTLISQFYNLPTQHIYVEIIY